MTQHHARRRRNFDNTPHRQAAARMPPRRRCGCPHVPSRHLPPAVSLAATSSLSSHRLVKHRLHLRFLGLHLALLVLQVPRKPGALLHKLLRKSLGEAAGSIAADLDGEPRNLFPLRFHLLLLPRQVYY